MLPLTSKKRTEENDRIMTALKASYAEKPKILSEINQLKADIEGKNDAIQAYQRTLMALKRKIMIYQLEMYCLMALMLGKIRCWTAISRKSFKK